MGINDLANQAKDFIKSEPAEGAGDSSIHSAADALN